LKLREQTHGSPREGFLRSLFIFKSMEQGSTFRINVPKYPAIVKVLEEADEDPASAFEAAILAQLHQLREPALTGRYLLIDALDEALARTKGQTIVDLLSSRINRLPPWLRIVATTRNEQNVLNQLRGLTARELDAHDEQNLSDVRRFIAD
jgi:hypothetical protein